MTAFRPGLALLLVLSFSSTAAAQDTVRLRNGKVLCGTVVLDPADKDGFKLIRWDTQVTLSLRWSQVPDSEKRRILNRGVELPPPSLALGEPMDGVRIVTSGRELIGVVQKETDTNTFVKIASAPNPVPVAKASIIVREDVKIHEADAYSPEEMIGRRTQGVGDDEVGRWVEIGKFAQALKLYDRAKELFLKAVGGDPAKDVTVAGLLEENARLAREDGADKALAGVRKLADELQYAAALEALDKLFSEFADTEVAKGAKGYQADLEKKHQEYQANRSKVLAVEVPKAWIQARTAALEQASRMKKWAEASAAATSMDADILKRVVAKIKCTPEEAESSWAKRTKESKSLALEASSWLVLNGQDGGSDLISVETKEGGNPVDDLFQNPNPGGRGGGNKPPKQEPKKTYGKPLQSSEEWWTSASSYTRRIVLEALYAMNSPLVERDEPATKKCRSCSGEGHVKVTRSGQNCDVHCSRCHGVKHDVTITYR